MGSPHTPALLASPLGSPASSHGASQAALGSLSEIFSYLLSYPGWGEAGRGDSLCSAPIRPHPGTMSCLGSQTGDTLTNQRGSQEATGTVGLKYSP